MSSAWAAPLLREYTGKYAIDSHRIVDGYFTAPKGQVDLDTVVIVSASGRATAEARAAARRHAAGGKLAIVPDLPATYRAAALGGHAMMVAALRHDLPRLQKMAQSSGRVSFVAI